MFSPSAIVREIKEDPGQIKSEWLGAEAHVHLPSCPLAEHRFIRWGRRVSLRIWLLSFPLGLAMGSCLTLFARGQFGNRHRCVG